MPQITKMIVHDLNLGNEQPIYSDSLINLEELNNNSSALDFFNMHITNNRNIQYIKQCKFDTGDATHVKNAMIDIATTDNLDETFIAQSRVITEHMANSMRNRSSSNGSIFILKYNYQNIEYIGILKMDPNLGIEVRPDLTLKVRSHMLPSVKEKLHKSAFIKLQQSYNNPNVPVELFVLDRQQNTGETAKYFLTDFLQAKEVANPENLTKEIERAIYQEFLPLIDTEERKVSFMQQIKSRLINEEQFVLQEDLRVLGRPYVEEDHNFEENENNIIRAVTAKYPDAVFTIRPAAAKVKPIQYRSDDKLVTIAIHPSVNDYVDYSIDEDNYTVFKFSPILNIKSK